VLNAFDRRARIGALRFITVIDALVGDSPLKGPCTGKLSSRSGRFLSDGQRKLALVVPTLNHHWAGAPAFSQGRSEASAASKLSANRRDGWLPSKPIGASTVRRAG
jgi:hypothetical protein